MNSTIENNTRLFYSELNNEYDPNKLLNIARQGIFLKEPLLLRPEVSV